jgi:hypothetical protein
VLTNPGLFDGGDDVEPDAPAPAGGVTGQDPASIDRDGDGEPDGGDGDGPDGEALIAGSAAAVEKAVGGNAVKAQAALDAENAKAKPRKNVVALLKAIVSAG